MKKAASPHLNGENTLDPIISQSEKHGSPGHNNTLVEEEIRNLDNHHFQVKQPLVFQGCESFGSTGHIIEVLYYLWNGESSGNV